MFELEGLTRESARSLFPVEQRIIEVPFRDIQWRESGTGDGSKTLSGYAAVFNQVTTLYDGTYYRMDEVILPGAFDAVLAKHPDVHFNHGHDMKTAMARTLAPGPIGKLDLTADLHGLKVHARLNPNDPDVIKLAAKMDYSVIDQMSFMFRCLSSGYKWESETDENGKEIDLRTIKEISELFDVCVCAQGAYATTSADLRTLLAAAGERARAVPETPAPGQRSQEVAGDANAASVPSPTDERRKALMAARARAAVARLEYPEMEDTE